jgi:hypothetical protein
MTSTIELRNMLTLDYEVGPFVSLFVSFNEVTTHEQFLKLISSVKNSFIQKHDEQIWPRYERKLKRFNFNRAKQVGNGSGIALYISFKAIHSFNLIHPVATKFSIEDTMNISQLIKELECDIHYHLILLHDHNFKIFRVDNENFQIINIVNQPISVLVNHDKSKYYQLIDEYVHNLFDGNNCLPIVLVANEANQQLFTKLSEKSSLTTDINYILQKEEPNATELTNIVKNLTHQLWNKKVSDQKKRYQQAISDGLVVRDLDAIIYNAISGKIDTIFIREDKYNKIYNDLAITTIGFAGKVLILSANQMPANVDCAAITIQLKK